MSEKHDTGIPAGPADGLPASSDSVRSARPLRHAHHVTLDGPLELELGERLEEVTVCYETYGSLDADGGNTVLICHALSGDSHVARHDPSDDPGWWDILVGPGRPVDTDRYFVVCANVLGGCRGTTGPNSIDPATGRPYGRRFPTITVRDMVEVQRRLLEKLGIRRLLAVIGGSMGGQLVLRWAADFPETTRGYIPIATAARLTSQAMAFDIVGRNAILRDPRFQDGQYYGRKGPDTGLAIARMIGHITYLSRESMQVKFGDDRLAPRDVPTEFEKRFSVGSYLGYQGDRFVERFDANSYIALTMAMDLFDLGGTREALQRSIGRARARWLILSYSSDWLFPPEESQRMVDALASAGRAVSYCNVSSSYGHDSFLLEHNLEIYGELIRAFLDSLASGAAPGRPAGPALDGRPAAAGASVPGGAAVLDGRPTAAGASVPAPRDPLSIFHPNRLDYERIVRLIPPGSSVLDLGCGEGELLSRLREMGCTALSGVELDEKAIVACQRRGLDVLQADLNRPMDFFPDSSYDTVVLSRTLQAVLDVEGLLAEILRIGRRAIVSFPNFAYRKLRRMLAEEGRAPESSGILHYKWYNTPNRRFFTITDFEELCRERGIAVHQRVFLDTEAGREIDGAERPGEDPNLNADLAIFVISR